MLLSGSEPRISSIGFEFWAFRAVSGRGCIVVRSTASGVGEPGACDTLLT